MIREVQHLKSEDVAEKEKPLYVLCNEKQFLVHKVLMSDSLTKLSLMYNVSQKDIKLCNGLTMDQIFQRKELLIPVTKDFKEYSVKPLTAEQIQRQEEAKREMAIHCMTEYVRERLPADQLKASKTKDFRAEALFYCSDNNYEYHKAKKHFDEDLKFEEDAKKMERPKKKKFLGLF